ncbi:MAG: ACT domain-containing protein [Phycisphaerae bacterium]|nr:ACT domain-containing protein [Phycisphaerae bacterium]
MRIETQFSIFLVNKPGVLAQVTSAMAKAKVNIIALTLVDSSEHGVLRIVCGDKVEKVRRVLALAHDQFTETEVLAMDLSNNPGAFAASADKLAAEHININYAYCTGGARGGKTTAIFKVADLKKALRVLKPVHNGRKVSRTPVKSSPRRRR